MNDEPRVLIVESNDALRAMLFTILRHQPVGVDTAATAADALQKVSQCDYALAVVDLDCANNAGITFITRFREDRPDATTFILAVRDPKNDVYLDPDLIAAVLNKPLEIDTLAELVRECAHVVPVPEEPLPCPNPAESDIRTRMERGSYVAN
ncbi:MAG TPA: response regulator [Thermoanaerobaculia bacterium]|jgi:DNA-binding response OmpR family regulator|nr:response regulator [Thermoanaerobaculia bacterium]